MLRYGVMCDGKKLEEWQKKSIEHLSSIKNITLGLLIIDSENSDEKNKSFNRFLYSAYRRTWFKKSPRRVVDMSSYFSEVPSVVPIITKKGKFSEYFDEKSIKIILRHDLDFILRYGFNIIRGDILKAARCGV
jgi:hypothetical protein